MKLRDYQDTFLNQLRLKLSKTKNILSVLPCGAGKTVLFAYIANNHIKLNDNNEVWFIVHRRELIDQAKSTFEEFNIQSDRIKIFMVQSLSNMIKKGLELKEPTMIIFDESQHCTSNTWLRIINSYPKAYKIGLTATPCRLDGTGLGNVFDEMLVGVSAKYLINNGYLAPYDYYAPKLSINAQDLKIKGSDYDSTYTTELFEKSKIYGDVVSNYIRLAKGRKSILYAPSIEFSNKICVEFQSYGINAVHFDGNTPSKERDRIIKDFRDGKIDILSNVDLIGEGFNVPDCECCLLLRPTMSLGLYIQQSMRCMRFKENKRAIIIDYVGNCFRHGLPDDDREWSLKGKMKCLNESADKDIISRECNKCHRVYSGIAPICPYCGNDNHKTRKQIEQEEQAELEKITKIEKKNKRKEVGMTKSLEDLVKLGKSRGYSNPYYWARCVWNSREINKLRRN